MIERSRRAWLGIREATSGFDHARRAVRLCGHVERSGAAAVGAVAASLCVLWAAWSLIGRGFPPAEAPQPAAPPATTAIYCQFYVFVESRPFVAFMLEETQGAPGTYRQAYVAKADGDRTDYNVLVDRSPEWRYVKAQPPRLESRVMTPDPGPAGIAEQDIAIEIPGFEPPLRGGGWREASLKSVYYQNLPGKCRPSVPGGPAS